MPTFDVAKILALIKEIITDIIAGMKNRRDSDDSPYFFKIMQNVRGGWVSAGTEVSPAKVSKRLNKAKSSSAVGPLRVEVWELKGVWTGHETPVEVFTTDEWMSHGFEKYNALSP